MKKKCLLVLLLCLSYCFAFATENLDSLLQILDKTIAESETYVRIKEQRLEDLKKKIKQTRSGSIERFDLNFAIYEEFHAYHSDSALYYLTENILLAQQMKDREREIKTQLSLSYLLSSTGMYLEANDILNSIDRPSLSNDFLGEYYVCREHVYSEAGAAMPRYKPMSSHYFELRRLYRDSILIALEPSSDTYLWVKECQLREQKNFEEALKINQERLLRTSFATPLFALVAYQRFSIYRDKKEIEGHLHFLVLSAISDVRLAIKAQSSLMVLAQVLYDRGDMNRAYTYMNFSWEGSQFYNARLRSWMSIGPLSMINGTYQKIINQQNRKLQIFIVCMALLALLLVGALIYIYRQMKALSLAKRGLQKVNKQLNSLNEELELVNQSLRSANMELSESNEIKEAYIARFFKLCAIYVDRLQAYRRLVNKKVQKGQIDDLLKMTRPNNDVMTVEIEELYANFDSAFLHLFPNFVESLNNLLLPGEQIVLKQDELLNTELRIFALIRLGIKDSSQIAELLHYSVNTIYNYRARVKSKARVSREDFEDLIATIR